MARTARQKMVMPPAPYTPRQPNTRLSSEKSIAPPALAASISLAKEIANMQAARSSDSDVYYTTVARLMRGYPHEMKYAISLLPVRAIQDVSDWRDYELRAIDSDVVFDAYMAELKRENAAYVRVYGIDMGFWHNREQLRHAYRTGRLFTLGIIASSDTPPARHRCNPIYVKKLTSSRHLPVILMLSATNDKEVDLLWVAPRARKLGFGSTILKLKAIESVRGGILDGPSSRAFWSKCPQVDTRGKLYPSFDIGY